MNFYVDFEYTKNVVTNKFNLICASVEYDNVVTSFDLRTSTKEFETFVLDKKDSTFIAYNISGAEAQVFTQIFGVDFVKKMNWVDAWAEFKMYSMTHPDYSNMKTGFITALETFKIEYLADKEGTRDIILNNSVYTDEQFLQIVKYCEADVVCLRPLMRALFYLGQNYNVTLGHMLERGRYCRNVGISQYMCRGFQLDSELTRLVFSNRSQLKNAISLQCNQVTGFEIYKPVYKGKKDNKILSNYSFNFDNFERYLENKNLLRFWKRTESNRLCMEDDYVSEMVSNFKTIIEPVYNARNTLKQLNSTDLSTLMDDEGYIKPDYWPYNQKTSRTSPKPASGFIMNLCPWLRMLCRPAKGRALVTIDFKSQEVLVAAALSKDYSMLEDYLTDIYLGQGIKTGFIPVGATKDTHKTMRNAFKPVVLGTSFGMQAKSLSTHFFEFYKAQGVEKDIVDCESDARDFLSNHKESYASYYEFLSETLYEIRENGYIETADNWKYFNSYGIRENSVKNLKMQGNGAAMTRVASNYCIETLGVYVIPLHDAVYFECSENEAIELAKKVSSAMVQASIDVLGDDFGKHMGTTTQIYTNDVPYYDSRGESMYKLVCKELNYICPDKFSKAKELENIHLN